MKNALAVAFLASSLFAAPAMAQTAAPSPTATKSPKQIRAFCSRYLTGSKVQVCIDSLMGKPVDPTLGLPPEEAALVKRRGSPCHIETYNGTNDYHTETFWYCNADGHYEEAFTFTNGHQTSHYVP